MRNTSLYLNDWQPAVFAYKTVDERKHCTITPTQGSNLIQRISLSLSTFLTEKKKWNYKRKLFDKIALVSFWDRWPWTKIVKPWDKIKPRSLLSISVYLEKAIGCKWVWSTNFSFIFFSFRYARNWNNAHASRLSRWLGWAKGDTSLAIRARKYSFAWVHSSSAIYFKSV